MIEIIVEGTGDWLRATHKKQSVLEGRSFEVVSCRRISLQGFDPTVAVFVSNIQDSTSATGLCNTVYRLIGFNDNR